MATLTIEVPDDLLERLNPIKDQIPKLLQQCLQPSPLPAQTYRYILNFLTSKPTPEQIAAFRPTPEMQQRLSHLLARNADGLLSPDESLELDEYERIEHIIILLKTGNLPFLSDTPKSS